MTSPKDKGDAGEAAYARQVAQDGGFAFPLSPAFASADLLVLRPSGRWELVEVKAWKRKINPATLAYAQTTLHGHRRSVPARWRRSMSLVFIHAVKGEDGAYRFAETWRFP